MASIQVRCLSVLMLLLVIRTASARSQTERNSAEKVPLDLYYETLCPYCANFIVNELAPIFDNGLIDIIDLKLYPWGNAKVISGDSVACQHGPSECLLNEIDACTLDVWPLLGEHFPFISCVESLVYEGKYTQWETCFHKLGLDPKPVIDCYSSGHGKTLTLHYGEVTNALKPPKRYVPWVVVDGQPLYEEYDEFTSYVCKSYKGIPPSACSELSNASATQEKTKHIHPFCYTQEGLIPGFTRGPLDA
ncbi:hypothetical protein vseg_013275 [Gypsophila vaccaria]